MTELPSDESILENSIQEVQLEAIKLGCEGIIVKSRDAKYVTDGTRVNSWIKLKNVNLNTPSTDETGLDQTVRDTLDLIPIGAYYGQGSRAGVYGSYLMAAYSVSTAQFYSVCKLGTGFSQDKLE